MHFTGIQLVHIPYIGRTPAMLDLLGGRVEAMFNGLSLTLGEIKIGHVRPLAIDTPTRVPLLPQCSVTLRVRPLRVRFHNLVRTS